jgi:hypothetical protein
MRPWKILIKLLLITLLVFTASGVVSAKVASGPQNLAAALLQGESLFNALPCLEKSEYSTTVAPGCSVVAKSAGLLGKEGEAAVRAAYDIGDKSPVFVNGATRIPDGINLRTGVLSEVKNVQSLSFTQQLRDYSSYAQQNGLSFDLYTRPDTKLSGPLQDAISSGLINRLNIPK